MSGYARRARLKTGPLVTVTVAGCELRGRLVLSSHCHPKPIREHEGELVCDVVMRRGLHEAIPVGLVRLGMIPIVEALL